MLLLFRDAMLETNKETRAAIRKICGVGWRKAIWATSKIGLAYPFYLNRLNKYNFSFLSSVLKLAIISDSRIKRRVEFDIARLVGINNLKGLRHKLCLPVHGQRTRTNACTQRAKRVRPTTADLRRLRKTTKKQNQQKQQKQSKQNQQKPKQNQQKRK